MMTTELLERIIAENNIPKDVHLMSDSETEVDPAEIKGIFYNKKTNTIIFTQGCLDKEYDQSEEWEVLYYPELIKLNELEIYPAFSILSRGLNEAFKKELKAAGDFELFYGINENEDRYDEIDLQRPLYFSIKKNGEFIGYIGFHGDDDALEPEIYIFKQFRNNGYGTRVLKSFVDRAFKEGLKRTTREKADNPPPLYTFKTETIFPRKLVSEVREENEFSQKMMLSCGFQEIKKAAVAFALLEDENNPTLDFIDIRIFEITKEENLKREKEQEH